MIADLIAALDGEVGRVELRGLLSTLRRRWSRLVPGAARDATAADGRVLARAVERIVTDPAEVAAAAEIVRRWAGTLYSSDEVVGRPECSAGCPDRLVLVVDGAALCVLCDAPAQPVEVPA